MMHKKGIYAIINKTNGKIYIGSASNNFNHRYKTHIRLLKENKHHSILLQRAFNKYGIKNFKFKIIEVLDDNILEREQYYLDYYESYKSEKGYNICQFSHSTKGFKHSKELKNKLSVERLGSDNPFYGRKHSSNVRKTMGLSKRTINLNDCFLIKDLILKGKSNDEIALIFNTSESTIKRIKHGAHWSTEELGGKYIDWILDLERNVN